MSFLEYSIGKAVVWRSSLLLERGLQHGFLGSSYNFVDSATRQANIQTWLQDFKFNNLYLLKQIHGNCICHDFTQTADLEADAFFILKHNFINGDAAGIVTADCLPIILYSSQAVALVHAGWRGLANGIIYKVIECFKASVFESPEIAVIGPAAGGQDYEVGSEVIEGIGQDANYIQGSHDKFLLDLAATAAKQINRSCEGQVQIESFPFSTVSDARFHSYRRAQRLAGRNLSYVASSA